MKNMAYNVIDNAPRDTHFAAVNSGNGFLSYFPQVFGNDKIRKRYVIKGGPGTGKSSFMRRVAEYAEARGRGVEYFRCSSDPESLDGIIIDGSVAVFDGTAPHVYEPRLIGVVDNIVNLCVFWDEKGLEAKEGEIRRLTSVREGAYRKAYRFLSAVANLNEINDSLVCAAVDRGKMRAAVGRILRQVKEGDSFSFEYGIVNAVGMSGLTHLSSLEKKAERIYFVLDSYGLGWHFLSEAVEGAMARRVRTQISYDPIEPNKPDGVYFPDDGIALLLCRGDMPEGAVTINMNRFVIDGLLSGVKAEYRYNKRISDALLRAAVDSLAEAGKYHFELEALYKECMDFEAESAFTDRFCREHID